MPSFPIPGLATNFDPLHILFQNQQALDPESLKLYAENIGLDATDFSICLDLMLRRSAAWPAGLLVAG